VQAEEDHIFPFVVWAINHCFCLSCHQTLPVLTIELREKYGYEHTNPVARFQHGTVVALGRKTVRDKLSRS